MVFFAAVVFLAVVVVVFFAAVVVVFFAAVVVFFAAVEVVLAAVVFAAVVAFAAAAPGLTRSPLCDILGTVFAQFCTARVAERKATRSDCWTEESFFSDAVKKSAGLIDCVFTKVKILLIVASGTTSTPDTICGFVNVNEKYRDNNARAT